MSFTNQEFPNSDYYNSDLRQVLKYVRDFETRLDNYDEVIAELQEALEGIEGMQAAITALQNATADLATIRANISTLQTNVVDLNNEDASLQTQIDALRTSIEGIGTAFNQVYAYIDSAIKLVNVDVRKEILELQTLINTINAEMQNSIQELDDKLNEVLENLSYDVFNPIQHNRISFDDNNKAVYVDLRDDGMSYGELSARQFTYGYIRDAKWTHRLFSTKGRRYVTHGDTNLYSSISGRWTNWTEALSHAVGFIFDTINYGELAEEEITYAQMESLTYADLIRVSNRESLTYGTLAQLSTNGNSLIGF